MTPTPGRWVWLLCTLVSAPSLAANPWRTGHGLTLERSELSWQFPSGPQSLRQSRLWLLLEEPLGGAWVGQLALGNQLLSSPQRADWAGQEPRGEALAFNAWRQWAWPYVHLDLGLSAQLHRAQTEQENQRLGLSWHELTLELGAGGWMGPRAQWQIGLQAHEIRGEETLSGDVNATNSFSQADPAHGFARLTLEVEPGGFIRVEGRGQDHRGLSLSFLRRF